jgi:hypothetical protein
VTEFKRQAGVPRWFQIAVATFHAAVEEASCEFTLLQYAALTTIATQPG